MPDPAIPPDSPTPARFPWRASLQRSTTAIYFINANRRLVFANTAWEQLTGQDFAKVRGTKISLRASTTELGQILAPPVEVWHGEAAHRRRPALGQNHGPPWWEIHFQPLRGEKTVLQVMGFLSVIGQSVKVPSVVMPKSLIQAQTRLSDDYTWSLWEGSSIAMQQLLTQARFAATGQQPIWILGATATGKETLARVIHHQGLQRDRAFVCLDANSLQPYLIESLLFGKGGIATQPKLGTLLLKAPEKLSLDLQQRILDWQEKFTDVRCIAASTMSPNVSVAAKTLLPNYQTNWTNLTLHLPLLRERLDELPQWLGSDITLSNSVLKAFQEHDWPGNFREFHTILRQMAKMKMPISTEQLPRYLAEKALISQQFSQSITKPRPDLDTILETIEKKLIEHALLESAGNQTEAAKRLGIFRTRLSRRMDALGITSAATTQPRKAHNPPQGGS